MRLAPAATLASVALGASLVARPAKRANPDAPRIESCCEAGLIISPVESHGPMNGSSLLPSIRARLPLISPGRQNYTGETPVISGGGSSRERGLGLTWTAYVPGALWQVPLPVATAAFRVSLLQRRARVSAIPRLIAVWRELPRMREAARVTRAKPNNQ